MICLSQKVHNGKEYVIVHTDTDVYLPRHNVLQNIESLLQSIRYIAPEENTHALVYIVPEEDTYAFWDYFPTFFNQHLTF